MTHAQANQAHTKALLEREIEHCEREAERHRKLAYAASLEAEIFRLKLQRLVEVA